MDLRRMMTVLAVPCAFVAAERAIGQDRSYGPQDPARTSIVPSADDEKQESRLPVIPEEPRGAPISMIESWTLDDNAEFGLGRFRVGEIARPRTNLERIRMAPNDRENRAIAGAGLSIRFR